MAKALYQKPESPITYLRKAFFRFLLYPYSITTQYQNYNARVGDIVNETKDDDLDRIRKNNGRLVLFFIYLPLILGLLFSIISIYFHSSEYSVFISKITSPIVSNGISEWVGKFFKRISYFYSNHPIVKTDYIFLFYGYLISLVGAKFLSFNPAFKEEEKIQKFFANLDYTDAQGKPWQVTWTPDAIMIVSFNCDPRQLCANTRFWSTINFRPGTLKLAKTNMNKFIVQKAYELPPLIQFSFKDLKNSKK